MKKLDHMMKLLVPKFPSDLSPRLKDVAEKQVPVKLKPIVNTHLTEQNIHRTNPLTIY